MRINVRIQSDNREPQDYKAETIAHKKYQKLDSMDFH